MSILAAARAVPEGEDLLESVRRIPASEGAWVSAVGALEAVQLAVAGVRDDVVLAVPGRATLVSLSGPVAGPLMVVLAQADATGVRLVGGRLVGGRSGGVTLWVAGGERDAGTPAGAEVKPSTAAAPTTWAAAAASAPPPDEDEADELPQQGDRVDHFVFGLCDVMVVRGERLKLREVAGGKLREIHVGPFRLRPPRTVDGKRVFQLVKRG